MWGWDEGGEGGGGEMRGVCLGEAFCRWLGEGKESLRAK